MNYFFCLLLKNIVCCLETMLCLVKCGKKIWHKYVSNLSNLIILSFFVSNVILYGITYENGVIFQVIIYMSKETTKKCSKKKYL